MVTGGRCVLKVTKGDDRRRGGACFEKHVNR